MMLAQLMNLPVKFFLSEAIEIQNKFKDKDIENEQIKLELIKEKQIVVSKFDAQMRSLKVQKQLLERLKKEFDDSHSLSS